MQQGAKVGPARRRSWRRAGATAVLGAVTAARPAGAATAPPPPPPPGPVTPAEVQASIERGRNYLFAHQANGNWETVQARNPKELFPFGVGNVQWGGLTALVTYGLLASGVDARDPRLAKPIAFLRAADVRGNYALGLRAQVWSLLPQEPWVRQAELADLKRLEQGVHAGKTAGVAAGLYGYSVTSPPTEADHSVSQFAVLGMWGLAQSGVEVPSAYWQFVDEAWHRQQQQSGAWGYWPVPHVDDPDARNNPGLSMTAAGVATLFITQEYTQMAPRCSGNIDDPGIDAGLRYLGDHLNGLGWSRRYYSLFGISRVGLASGYKYLGRTDWFAWGSDLIVHEQDAHSGGWLRQVGSENVGGLPDTAFALLFLSRGRAPTMMNKLAYDVATGAGTSAGVKPARPTPGLWDQRPRDVANLSRWVGRQIESTLNWQVVNLRQSPGDLHDAPILYMAGGKAPKLSADDAAKLRTYLEDGGLLLGHADCGSSDFSAGFKALGEQLFPGHKFRPLPTDSPIYTKETFPRAHWATKPSVDALTNGARELMVLLPQGDPGKVWQSQSFQSVKNDTFGQLMINLLLYAVDKEGLRRRGETYYVDRRGDVPASKPVRLARVRYAGNWNPEPGGWRRLANVLHNERVAELSVETVAPSAGGRLDPAAMPLASLTVAEADMHLSDADRQALREYVRGGGTLLVDVAGGASAYRSAAEAELAKIFPDAPRQLPALAPDAPVYTFGGPRMTVASVDYRRFERATGTLHRPQLRGYTVDGRVAVVYSPEDVSVGLVGQPLDGIAGYVPADATRVVSAVIAYAAKLRP